MGSDCAWSFTNSDRHHNKKMRTTMAEMLSGGDMLIRALQDEGVEYIFG